MSSSISTHCAQTVDPDQPTEQYLCFWALLRNCCSLSKQGCAWNRGSLKSMSACLLCSARQLLSSAMQGEVQFEEENPNRAKKREKKHTEGQQTILVCLKYSLLPHLYDLLCDGMQWKKGEVVQEWSLENRWKHHEETPAWCFPWRIKEAAVPFSINKNLHWFLNYRYPERNFSTSSYDSVFSTQKATSQSFVPARQRPQGHFSTAVNTHPPVQFAV